MDRDAMMAQPTFAALPAAAAGQVYPWEFMSMDYRGQAIVLGNLAENLSAAGKVV
jgi:iron complex transport system substrate-binding protein